MADHKSSKHPDSDWKQIQQELYPLVRRRLQAGQEVDDLVQQVELVLLKKFDGDQALFDRLRDRPIDRARYLSTVVRNVVQNDGRSERRYRLRVKPIPPDQLSGAPSTAEKNTLDLRHAHEFMEHVRLRTDADAEILRAAISILTNEHTISTYARASGLPMSTARRQFLEGVRRLAGAFREFQNKATPPR